MGVGAAVLYAAQEVRTKLAASRDCRRMRGEMPDGRIRRRGRTNGVPVADVAASGRGFPAGRRRGVRPTRRRAVRGRRQGDAVRDAHLRGHLRGGGHRSRARAPAPPARRRQLQRRTDHQPTDRAGTDDRRHHLGLGHGGDGGEPLRANARALALEEPGRRCHPGERGHPG